MNHAQSIGERPAGRGNATLRDDGKRALSAVDDTETSPQRTGSSPEMRAERAAEADDCGARRRRGARA
jgi:hypothetical protein